MQAAAAGMAGPWEVVGGEVCGGAAGVPVPQLPQGEPRPCAGGAVQAGTPGGVPVPPPAPPSWTQDTPIRVVGLLAWCCVTLLSSCHLWALRVLRRLHEVYPWLGGQLC